MKNQAHRRLLVIGLDGFDAGVAQRLANDGRMPNYARLLEKGAFAGVEHGDAMRTGLAWEHFAAGLSPVDANRWSVVHFDAQRYAAWQEPAQFPPFTAHLSGKAVVFDAPYFRLDLTENVEGFVNWGAHDPGVPAQSKPASLAEEVETEFGAYPAKEFIYGYTWASAERTERMGERLIEATRLRADISEWLLFERLTDWQLGVVVVSEVHSATEALWHGIDPQHRLHGQPSSAAARRGLEGVYEAVDALIGRLHQAAEGCDLLLLAVHGMGANQSDVASMALLPEWLYHRQFGRRFIRNAGGPRDFADVGENEDWSWHVWHQTEAGHRSLQGKVLQKLGLKKPAERPLTEVPDGAVSLDWMPAAWYQAHWPEMAAFAMPSFYDGQIRLNVAGREARGCVAPEDYDRFCQALEAALRACVNPETGASVVREVVRTRPGDPMAVHHSEADLVVVWEGAVLAMQTPDGEVFGPLAYRRPGGHTCEPGVALWCGDGFRPGDCGKVSAFDVVPTILHHINGRCGTGLSGRTFLEQLRPTHQG